MLTVSTYYGRQVPVDLSDADEETRRMIEPILADSVRVLWLLPKDAAGGADTAVGAAGPGTSGGYDGFRTATPDAMTSQPRVVRRPFTLSWQQQFPPPAHPDELVAGRVHVPLYGLRAPYSLAAAVETRARPDIKVA